MLICQRMARMTGPEGRVPHRVDNQPPPGEMPRLGRLRHMYLCRHRSGALCAAGPLCKGINTFVGGVSSVRPYMLHWQQVNVRCLDCLVQGSGYYPRWRPSSCCRTRRWSVVRQLNNQTRSERRSPLAPCASQARAQKRAESSPRNASWDSAPMCSTAVESVTTGPAHQPMT